MTTKPKAAVIGAPFHNSFSPASNTSLPCMRRSPGVQLMAAIIPEGSPKKPGP